MIIIAGLKTITGKSVMTDTSKLNPEINEHLLKENLYTEQVLEDLEPLTRKTTSGNEGSFRAKHRNGTISRLQLCI